MSAKVTTTCPSCSQPFEHFRSVHRVYCSTKCRRDSEGTVLHDCETCGKPMRVPKCHAETKRWCSRECRRFSPRAIGACIICGKTFEYITTARPGTYCSRACSNKNRAGRPEVRAAISRSHKARWAKMTMAERAEAMSSITFNKTQNKLETLLQRHLPPHVVYTGDHSFWVRLATRVKNPDFVVRPFRETRSVIEVFGDYWHDKREAVDLIAEYKEADVRCIVLMEHDIRDDPCVAANRAMIMLEASSW